MASCSRFSRSCARTWRLATAWPDKIPPGAGAGVAEVVDVEATAVGTVLLFRACASTTVAAGGGASILARFACRCPSPSAASSSPSTSPEVEGPPSTSSGDDSAAAAAATLPSSSSSSRTRWTNSGSSETWMPFSPSVSNRLCSFRFAAGFGSSVAHLHGCGKGLAFGSK